MPQWRVFVVTKKNVCSLKVSTTYHTCTLSTIQVTGYKKVINTAVRIKLLKLSFQSNSSFYALPFLLEIVHTILMSSVSAYNILKQDYLQHNESYRKVP